MDKKRYIKWHFTEKYISTITYQNKLQFGYKKKNNSRTRKTLNEKQTCNFLVDYRHNLTFNILKSNRDEIIFTSNEISLPHANSLRRILLGEIKIAAIHKVFFYYNSSILNDENIAHRLGLIPISVNSEFLNEIKKIDNKNFEQIILDFKIKNPKESISKISIYSKCLKLKNYGLFYSINKNLSVNPVYRDILILKLNPGQKLKCECHCIVNSGSTHAKFSPVGTAFYRISPKVKIVGEILGKRANRLYEICPVKIFSLKMENELTKTSLIVTNPNFCTLCKECMQIDIKIPKPIRISRVKGKLSFIIESTGVLSPENLFHRAVSLLVGKCNDSLMILFKSFSL
jgi:DNA-directed RNA polymerase I and III subunit RPAC1